MASCGGCRRGSRWSDAMSTLQRFIDRPGALIAVSLVLAVVVGVLTSSLFGIGLFLVLPSAVAWFARR